MKIFAQVIITCQTGNNFWSYIITSSPDLMKNQWSSKLRKDALTSHTSLKENTFSKNALNMRSQNDSHTVINVCEKFENTFFSYMISLCELPLQCNSPLRTFITLLIRPTSNTHYSINTSRSEYSINTPHSEYSINTSHSEYSFNTLRTLP